MSESSNQQASEPESIPELKRTGFLLNCGLAWCWFHLIVGALLKLTIRDRVPYLAIMFYASPAIVLAALCIVLAIRFGVLRRKRMAGGLLLLGVIYALWWHQSMYYRNLKSDSETASTHSVLLWNVRHVKAGWPRLLEELKRHDADLIGLVEAGPGDNAQLEQIRQAFPDHELRYVGMGMLLVRGQFGEIETGSLKSRGAYARTEVRFENGDRLDVFLVDILAKPWLPRRPAYVALEQIVSTESHNPRLVFGDFNTPPDSVFADLLRNEGLVNAFETAGNGYHVTWPVGLPVLALDQIWLDPETVHGCSLYDSPHSDHCMVTAIVSSSTD